METNPHKRPRIIFLFSDTGGGHRSAAEAIIEALELDYPHQIQTEMIDIFKSYAPTPLKYAPQFYPPISKMPDVWAFGYHISDGQKRTSAFNSFLWPYIRRATRKLVRENPADLIVSVHPLANSPVLRAMKDLPQPFMTVVTDMVSTHAFWYDEKADLVIVPTQEAKERGICYGVDPDKIRVVGLPVAQRFCHPPSDRQALRASLGWAHDKPVVLLIGGGEGMGPLEMVANAIDQAGLDTALAVVCGRNHSARVRLESKPWHIPASVYGFVRNMPDLMAAADILVTKAGPGTISEAFIAGLPMIIYSRMPGQEDGNVFYVINHKAGVWAPHPDRVVATLKGWIQHPDTRLKAVEACKRLAKPNASRDIARIIAGKVGIDHK